MRLLSAEQGMLVTKPRMEGMELVAGPLGSPRVEDVAGEGPPPGAARGRASPPWTEVASLAGWGARTTEAESRDMAPRPGHLPAQCLPGVSPRSCQLPKNPLTLTSQDVLFAKTLSCLSFYLLPARPVTEVLLSPFCRRTVVATTSNRKPDPHVTQSGVQLLADLKPILERQSWLKEKFASFWRPATRGEGELVSKSQVPPENQRARAFKGASQGCISGGRGNMQNRTGSSDGHLEIGHEWPDEHHLDCLSTVSLQFQGQFVPISLRPALEIVAAYDVARG